MWWRHSRGSRLFGNTRRSCGPPNSDPAWFSVPRSRQWHCWTISGPRLWYALRATRLPPPSFAGACCAGIAAPSCPYTAASWLRECCSMKSSRWPLIIRIPGRSRFSPWSSRGWEPGCPTFYLSSKRNFTARSIPFCNQPSKAGEFPNPPNAWPTVNSKDCLAGCGIELEWSDHFSRRTAKSFNWTNMFMDLEKILPIGVHVISIESKQVNGQASVKLTIGAASDEAKGKFLHALEQSNVFSHLQLINVRPPSRQTAGDQVELELTVIYSRA